MRKAKKVYRAKIITNESGGRTCRPVIPGIELSRGEQSKNFDFGDTLYYTMEWDNRLMCWIVVCENKYDPNI